MAAYNNISAIQAYIDSTAKNNTEFEQDYNLIIKSINHAMFIGDYSVTVTNLIKSVKDQIEFVLKTLGYTTKSHGQYGDRYDLEISWRFV